MRTDFSALVILSRMEESRRRRVLKQHVKTDQLLGVEAVPLGEVAEPVVPQAAETAPISAPAKAIAPPVKAQMPPVATEPTVNLFGTAPPPAFVPRAEVNDDALPPLPVYAKSYDSATKLHLMHSMDVDEVRACRKCVLCEGRTQTVFGEGDPDAKLLFIGEGPGENEDLQGRPFIGKAGQKLDEMIKAMGLDRRQVYIANVVKCRPPGNRAPAPAEVLSCWDFLKRQIETIQPRVIVTLGGPATKQILQTDRGITAIRGIWHSFNALKPAGPAVPVMPTFHPAYLLRAYTPENRKKVWSDLQKAMKMLKA